MTTFIYGLLGLICLLIIIGVAGAGLAIAMIIKDINEITSEDYYDQQ